MFHLHVSALDALVVGAYVILFAFAWRMTAAWLTARNDDSALGKAMAAIL